MEKYFNITGHCVPDMHYMIDLTDRVSQIEKMVDRGEYFTINRPRQYGKTTTLNAIYNKLEGRFTIIRTSFEGAGDALFSSEKVFCSNILKKFAMSVKLKNEKLYSMLVKHVNTDVESFEQLSESFSSIIKESGQDIILLIDEIDKSSNSKVFLQFLGLLRNKYLASRNGEDITFKSVILAGVHDIKNLKLAIREDVDKSFNSPWNIAAKFDIEMSLKPKEIASMLAEYKKDHDPLAFDEQTIAEEIFKFANGYPYLTSDICKIIDEDLNKEWTTKGVQLAVKRILKEKNTLFDDVIKNIENNPDMKDIVVQILLEGQSFSYSYYAYETGIIYGIYTEKQSKLVIHNKIYEELLYIYLLDQRNSQELAAPLLKVESSQFIKDGKLDMERILTRFKEFMYEEYRKEDGKFYESHGRMLFLSFLRPIINGAGFSFVEAETRENKRMDIVITYGNEKHVVELKLWRGHQAEERGLEQLENYLSIQGLDTGYMVIFNLNAKKEYKAEWQSKGEKRIFEVVV